MGLKLALGCCGECEPTNFESCLATSPRITHLTTLNGLRDYTDEETPVKTLAGDVWRSRVERVVTPNAGFGQPAIPPDPGLGSSITRTGSDSFRITVDPAIRGRNAEIVFRTFAPLNYARRRETKMLISPSRNQSPVFEETTNTFTNGFRGRPSTDTTQHNFTYEAAIGSLREDDLFLSVSWTYTSTLESPDAAYQLFWRLRNTRNGYDSGLIRSENTGPLSYRTVREHVSETESRNRLWLNGQNVYDRTEPFSCSNGITIQTVQFARNNFGEGVASRLDDFRQEGNVQFFTFTAYKAISSEINFSDIDVRHSWLPVAPASVAWTSRSEFFQVDGDEITFSDPDNELRDREIGDTIPGLTPTLNWERYVQGRITGLEAGTTYRATLRVIESDLSLQPGDDIRPWIVLHDCENYALNLVAKDEALNVPDNFTEMNLIFEAKGETATVRISSVPGFVRGHNRGNVSSHFGDRIAFKLKSIGVEAMFDPNDVLPAVE